MEKTQKVTFKQKQPMPLGECPVYFRGVYHKGKVLKCDKIDNELYEVVMEIEDFELIDFPDKKVAISTKGGK